jgi:hypothetical protein
MPLNARQERRQKNVRHKSHNYALALLK